MAEAVFDCFKSKMQGHLVASLRILCGKSAPGSGFKHPCWRLPVFLRGKAVPAGCGTGLARVRFEAWSDRRRAVSFRLVGNRQSDWMWPPLASLRGKFRMPAEPGGAWEHDAASGRFHRGEPPDGTGFRGKAVTGSVQGRYCRPCRREWLSFPRIFCKSRFPARL